VSATSARIGRVPARGGTPPGRGRFRDVSVPLSRLNAPPRPSACRRFETLSLLSWNVDRCRGRDGRFDPWRTVTALRRLAPRIVSLQGLDWDKEARHGLDQFRFIGAELGLVVYSGLTRMEPSRLSGNAILTDLPVHRCMAHDLTRAPSAPCGALELMLHCGDTELRLINVNLARRRKQRAIQIERLYGILDARPEVATILTGDLHESDAGSPVVEGLASRLPHFAQAETAPGQGRGRSSWIMTPRSIALANVALPEDRDLKLASSHRPVLSQIAVPRSYSAVAQHSRLAAE